MSTSQIVAACTIAAVANFDFVKTSTGSIDSAIDARTSEAIVRLMARCCDVLVLPPPMGAEAEPLTPPTASNGTGSIQEVGRRKMRVKASGGVRTVHEAVRMLEAGATRLGTSGGVWILKEGREAVERAEERAVLAEGRASVVSTSTYGPGTANGLGGVNVLEGGDAAAVMVNAGAMHVSGRTDGRSRRSSVVTTGEVGLTGRSRKGSATAEKTISQYGVGNIVIGNGIDGMTPIARASLDRPRLATRLFSDY